jgi:hypothetical protein
MKNGNLSLLFKALQECLMILHWVTKDIRRMFSTLTRAFFEISVTEGSSNTAHFSTDQIFRKVIKLNECLIKTRWTLGITQQSTTSRLPLGSKAKVVVSSLERHIVTMLIPRIRATEASLLQPRTILFSFKSRSFSSFL